MAELSGTSVVVLGAGVVGVCAALELQARGAKVTLVDRREPGKETSYGNAGVLATSSLRPLNNPDIWNKLPGLMTNKQSGFRYSPSFLMRNMDWALRFLSNARRGRAATTIAALDSLIRISANAHKELMKQAGVLERMNERGWIFLHARKRALTKRRGRALFLINSLSRPKFWIRAGSAILSPA